MPTILGNRVEEYPAPYMPYFLDARCFQVSRIPGTPRFWIVRYLRNNSGPGWSLASYARKKHGVLHFEDTAFNNRNKAIEYAISIARHLNYSMDIPVDVVYTYVWVDGKHCVAQGVKCYKVYGFEWYGQDLEDDIEEDYDPINTELNDFGRIRRECGKREHLVPVMKAR